MPRLSVTDGTASRAAMGSVDSRPGSPLPCRSLYIAAYLPMHSDLYAAGGTFGTVPPAATCTPSWRVVPFPRVHLDEHPLGIDLSLEAIEEALRPSCRASAAVGRFGPGCVGGDACPASTLLRCQPRRPGFLFFGFRHAHRSRQGIGFPGRARPLRSRRSAGACRLRSSRAAASGHPCRRRRVSTRGRSCAPAVGVDVRDASSLAATFQHELDAVGGKCPYASIREPEFSKERSFVL